jgi:hypothetical protein
MKLLLEMKVPCGESIEQFGKNSVRHLVFSRHSTCNFGTLRSKLKIERQLGFEDWVDDLRRESLVWQEVGEAGTLEGLKKELDVGERLDSAIMQCLKQLLMIRGIKSITAAPPASSSPKQIPKRLRAA